MSVRKVQLGPGTTRDIFPKDLPDGYTLTDQQSELLDVRDCITTMLGQLAEVRGCECPRFTLQRVKKDGREKAVLAIIPAEARILRIPSRYCVDLNYVEPNPIYPNTPSPWWRIHGLVSQEIIKGSEEIQSWIKIGPPTQQ